jgi:hypothetical protein
MWIGGHSVMIINKGRRPASCLSDLEEEMRVKLPGEPKPLKHSFYRSSPFSLSPAAVLFALPMSSPFPDDDAYPPTLSQLSSRAISKLNILSPLVFDPISRVIYVSYSTISHDRILCIFLRLP